MSSSLRNLVKVFPLPPGLTGFSSLVVRVRHPDSNNPAHLYFKDGRPISNLGLASVTTTGRLDVWVLPRADYIVQLMSKDLSYTYQEYRLPPNGDADTALPGGVTPSTLVSDDPGNALLVGTDSKLFVQASPQLSSALW